jgi:catechol 2,3-dioxygenase-like lactoylglutathione lyase family enzyme
LRCADIARTRAFYAALGLQLTNERHGGGASAAYGASSERNVVVPTMYMVTCRDAEVSRSTSHEPGVLEVSCEVSNLGDARIEHLARGFVKGVVRGVGDELEV